MNTKKLIGTIIGVTMFAVLIAGATFAWLTFGTQVTDNQYVGTTIQFLVDYTKGNAVQYTPILDSNLVKPGTSSDDNSATSDATKLDENEASGLVVILKKDANSVEGHGSIKLTTTAVKNSGGTTVNSAVIQDGVVRWAICRDTTVEATGNQIDNVCGGTTPDISKALNTGTITSFGTITLLNDAMLADGKTGAALSTDGGSSSTNNIITPAGTSYFVYFWLDGESITNSHVEAQYENNNNNGLIGDDGNLVYNLYEGYVHASATQLEN